jgi:hypothetical protein
VRGRILREFLSMGCYLEEYQARVGTWAARVLCRAVQVEDLDVTSGLRFHNNCGNVKAQVAESGTWICERCRSEILRLLEEKLQNALLQIEDLIRRNKALENQLRLASAGREVGRRDTSSGHKEDVKCLVVGD